MRRALLAAAAALGFGVANAGTAAAQAPFPFCAWWFETTATTTNVAFPDTSATYFTTPYTVTEPGMKIVVNGSYPETRFMSLTTYANTFGYFSVNGVQSQLTDYQIQPLPGSQNPWATVNASTGGSFSVAVQQDVGPGVANVLPILPVNSTANNNLPANVGFLVMRVYLPTGGPENVALPQVSIVYSNGSSAVLEKCSRKDSDDAQQSGLGAQVAKAINSIKNYDGPPPAPCAPTCPPDYQFFRATAATTGSFFPNAANAYLSMLFTPEKDKIVVIKMLAPTSPSVAGGTGTVPVAWPNAAYDVRYFSICTNVYAAPYPVVANNNTDGGAGVTFGCVADNEVVLVNGTATIVISRPSDRPSNANVANGYNWLPTSVLAPLAVEMVAIRNMLTTSGFTQSVLSVPQDANPASAQKAMGPYYPVVANCTKAQFESGASACVPKQSQVLPSSGKRPHDQLSLKYSSVLASLAALGVAWGL
ncbi:hypothetical protein DFJ74DRAFT_661840 [Hyaloraphidium curvatum]|nr:hypothetical protein DFJ74DRAFT_661840 [Hyaloraphidium curvatum]